MKRYVSCVGILVVLVGIGVPAQHQGPHRHSPSAVEDDGWSELTASMEKMHAAMISTERSGDNDLDFVRLMLPHHQAAIDMARTQLRHGKDPQMRRLAQEIITDQESEIELMQLWLRQHNGQRPKPATSAAKEQ
jgi:uncharacterized protein (DUF305 family)